MQSMLSRAKTFLTPVGSSSNLQNDGTGKFRTEKSAVALFRKTDPLIDGENCLHDCASCTESLPRKWSIDEEDKLYGHVKGWETHLVVGTGKTDWVRDVTDEKGSLMQAVGKLGVELANGKLMLSASDMGTGLEGDGEEYGDEGKTRCIVLPKWEMVEGVGVKEAQWLLQDVIARGSTNSMPLPKEPSNKTANGSSSGNGEIVVQREGETSEVQTDEGLSLSDASNPPPVSANGASDPLPSPSGVTIRSLPHRAIILMCSHGTRDWRCGKSAPIIKRELERHLRPLGLYRDSNDDRPGGVGIYFINHVGGHKYSANVMVYRRETKDGEVCGEAVQGIWLARVRPDDCENIVKYTVLQGKVVKPERQLRGGFDRERGLISW